MNYIIKKSTKEGQSDYCSVYARIRTEGEDRRYAVGFLIKISEWETYISGKFKAEDIMESIGIRYGLFANVLEQIKYELEEHFNPLTAKMTIKAIRVSVLEYYKNPQIAKPVLKKILLVDFIKACLDDYENGRRVSKFSGKPVSKSLISSIKNIISVLYRYEKDCEIQVTLDDVNMDFQRDFISWNKDRGIMSNTMTHYMYVIRAMMVLANEDKLTQNTEYAHSDFVPRSEEVDEIFLKPDQIQTIANLDLSSTEALKQAINNAGIEDKMRLKEILSSITETKTKQLEKARDVFLVGCYTGQRLSDYSRVNTDMLRTIKNKKFLRIVQQKTGKVVLIPYDLRVKAILKKYKGALPHVDTHTVNSSMRLIGEILGWTYKPNIDESKMGYKYGPRFCDMISSHTARRSFATNAYAAGVPLSSIMAITGHSREEKLRVYLKLQAEDKAVVAARDFKDFIK